MKQLVSVAPGVCEHLGFVFERRGSEQFLVEEKSSSREPDGSFYIR